LILIYGLLNKISVDSVCNNYLKSDYYETLLIIEQYVKKNYLNVLGDGIFQFSESDEAVRAFLQLRSKIGPLIDDLLDMLSIMNNKNEVLSLYSEIDNVFGKWLTSENNLKFIALKQYINKTFNLKR
ncbi:MAG: hypothetical protein ACFFD1_05830, partial [Candidatus Thorarchaeota archaeon]